MVLGHLEAKNWARARCVCLAARGAKPDQVWTKVPASQRHEPVALPWALSVMGPCRLCSVRLTGARKEEEFACPASDRAALKEWCAYTWVLKAINMADIVGGLHMPDGAVPATAGMLAIVRRPFPHTLHMLLNLQHLVIHHGEGSLFGFRHYDAGAACFEALSQLQQSVTLYCKLHFSMGSYHHFEDFLEKVPVDLQSMSKLKAVYLEPSLSNLPLPPGCKFSLEG